MAAADASRARASRAEVALFAAVIAWVAGMPTLFAFGNRALDPLPLVNLDRLGFALVAALAALHLMRRWDWRGAFGRVEGAMALYGAVVLLSWLSTVSEKDPVTLERDADFLLSSFAMPFAAFLVARHGGWSRAWTLRGLWLLVGGAGLYLAAVGLVQATHDWDFLVEAAARKVHPRRAKGPFPNAVIYGLVLSIFVTAALFLYARAVRGRGRFAVALVLAVLAEAVVQSRARAAWLGLLAAMLLVAVRCRGLRGPAALVVLVLAGHVSLSFAGVGNPTGPPVLHHAEALRDRLTESGSILDRVAVYATDLNMIAHRPLLGFGFGLETFQRHKADYYASCCGVSPKWAEDCAVPHNELLNVLVLTGAVGLVAYLVLVGSLWRVVAEAGARPRAPDAFRFDLAVCVQAAFVLLAVAGQLHDLMYLSYVLVLFCFLAGLAAGAGGRTPAPAGSGAGGTRVPSR